MARDATYSDDIVIGIIGVLDNPPAQGGREVYDIGGADSVGLMDMITTLETALGIEANKVFLSMPPGDLAATDANIDKLRAL